MYNQLALHTALIPVFQPN